MTTSILLDGNSLTAAQVAALARRTAQARVDPAARERMVRARAAAEAVVARRRVYGHTTGVGSNRSTDLPDDAADGHGMRLLRSHSGGIGPLVPVEETRAMLAVRLNQVLGAGSALSAEVADRLEQALASGHVPVVHALGSVGTADLSALAELGLALTGEQPWRRSRHGADRAGDGPEPAPIALDRRDALPLMSSSALTIGQAALAHTDLAALLDRFPLVAALSLAAVHGSTEPYAAIVHARRPHPGAMRTAARMRALLEPVAWTPPLVQDPFGFRCLPQVHGAALDAAEALERTLEVEINSAAENPLLALAPADYHHHGGFHQASLALALDQVRLAVLGTAQLSAARLGVLVSPAFTGLAPYLAQDDQDGSSGIMIMEYAAQSAIAELRGAAQPVTLGHAVLSRGVEEHASFAATGARRLLEAVGQIRLVLACELLAAIRTLRMRGTVLAPSTELGRFQREAEAALDPGTADRQLTADVEAAAALLTPRAPESAGATP